MTEIQNTKRQYDLEERTLAFAKDTRSFVKKIPRTIGNIEDGKQLIRSSGSIGANYIEANEAISRKDFIFRIKICRKETKESRYWLSLIENDANCDLDKTKQTLLDESLQLTKIFGSIVSNS